MVDQPLHDTDFQAAHYSLVRYLVGVGRSAQQQICGEQQNRNRPQGDFLSVSLFEYRGKPFLGPENPGEKLLDQEDDRDRDERLDERRCRVQRYLFLGPAERFPAQLD